MKMFSEIFLIPVVFLAVSQVKTQTIETLGELNSTCPAAGVCFKEQLFSDPNSVRNCITLETGSLVCISTCTNSYVYGDGATVKTFNCSGTNEWDYNVEEPANRFCLPLQSSDDTITTTVVYDYTNNNYQCKPLFASKVAPQLTTFGTRLSASCGLSWTVENTQAVLVGTSQFRATYLLKLQVPSSDTAKKNSCLQSINTNLTLFHLTDSELNCTINYILKIGTVSVNTVTAGEIVVNCRNSSHYKVFSQSLSADVCVPCGQGFYYSSAAGNCIKCPMGQYQDAIGQSQCKQCPAGSYPNSDQTQCQQICPAGQFRDPCQKTTCTSCVKDSYQDAAGMTSCIKCPIGKVTLNTSSTSVADCVSECLRGQFYEIVSGLVTCKDCPKGTYNTGTPTRMVPPVCSMRAGTSTEFTGATASTDCTTVLSSPDSSNPDSNNDRSPLLAAAVGGSVGGFSAGVVLVIVIIVLRRRYRVMCPCQLREESGYPSDNSETYAQINANARIQDGHMYAGLHANRNYGYETVEPGHLETSMTQLHQEAYVPLDSHLRNQQIYNRLTTPQPQPNSEPESVDFSVVNSTAS